MANKYAEHSRADEMRRLAKGCTGKRRFESEQDAMDFVPSRPQWEGLSMRAYLCPDCKGWHLSSQKARQ